MEEEEIKALKEMYINKVESVVTKAMEDIKGVKVITMEVVMGGKEEVMADVVVDVCRELVGLVVIECRREEGVEVTAGEGGIIRKVHVGHVCYFV